MTRKSPTSSRLLVNLIGPLALLVGCSEQPSSPPSAQTPAPAERTETAPSPAATPPYAKALAEFNRGAALMEQYRYPDAAKIFESVAEAAPDWTAARFNLGLAYFNMHGIEGGREHLETARRMFEAVLAAEPEHLPARFCLGLYHEHHGNAQEAHGCFQDIYERDMEDPHVAYKCAEALIKLGRVGEGKQLLEKVVALDPGFVSAVYGLATQYVRAGERDKAMPLFARFQELNTKELAGGTFAVQKIYGTIGKYYLALGADNLPLPQTERTPAARIVFSPDVKQLPTQTTAWPWPGGLVNLPGAAVGDLDGDGDLDLCLTAAGERGNATSWLNDGAGEFTRGAEIAQNGVSPSLGDVDNDGDLDLWLGCAGADVLFENDGRGNLSRLPLVEPLNDATKRRTVDAAASGQLTTCAPLIDIDSDGDLDLLSFRLARGSVPVDDDCSPAACSVLNNNLDGSFDDIAAKLGLVLADTPVSAVVYDDFDNDRDLDLLLFPASAPAPVAWVNDRVWQHRLLDAAATGLEVEGVTSAVTGDPNKDGRRDLLLFTGNGLRLFVNRGSFQFEMHRAFTDRCGRLGGTGGQFADMDNDGDLDIVVADAHRRDGSRGPALLINDWPRDTFIDSFEIDPGNLLAAISTKGDASCVVGDFSGNGRCDVLLAPMGDRPCLIENVTPGGHWIELDLRGARRQDRKTRSNNSAIGARVEVKTGDVFQQFVVGTPSGPTAMSPLRIHAGLGAYPNVDWLRIIWPDGVLQAECEMPGNQVTTVTELPRKTSSCPHLFAWDGARFRFVADFGGMGGLGYLTAPGTYALPDATEYLPLRSLQPRDGYYVLKVLEPLEEVIYFDEAKLIAVDHALATEVHPHEMMAVGVPPPTFEVFCIERPIELERAIDHRGADVTGALRRIDRRYAGATDPDSRFAGLAERHFVELDFGGRLKGLPPNARLILILNGWVEYGYSSTNFAAAQAGLRTEAPTVQVERDGRWVELFREVGYPAGLQHTMTLDVTGKIRPTDRRLRISSNMDLYWDRIFLGVHADSLPLTLNEVAVETAELSVGGYPREYSPDGRHPNLYDYDNLDRAAAWKLMAGSYTRFGDVTELMEAADDCFVIMGRGEQLTLRFPADTFGPVPDGCRRTFLFKADSYCKDMDLCTAHGDTVHPLPFHGMSGYPYGPHEHYPDTEETRRYRSQFNIREIRVR